jgi:hypothetical protein
MNTKDSITALTLTSNGTALTGSTTYDITVGGTGN